MIRAVPPVQNKVMRLMGARSSTLDLARGRIVLIGVFFAFAYILIGARVIDLTVIRGGLRGADILAEAPQEEAPPVHARADITDRNGVLLATSLETASLYADPAQIIDPEKAAEGLVAIFPDLSYGDVLQKLQGDNRFVWIRRNLTPGEQYAVLELGQPGLNFRKEMRRIYPQVNLLSHVLGYANVDGRGLSGIERSFDRTLRDSDHPLALTLDVRIQHILRRELAAAMNEYSGKAASGLVMNIHTGEVLAAVSLPDFDPHDPGKAGPDKMFNRVTLGVYELGSMFKIFSVAAYLELKNGNLGQVFETTQPIKRGRFVISDYHPEKHPLTIPEIFMYSSNIGAALMGEQVGTDGVKNFYRDLGLLSQLRMEIAETGVPLVPEPWRDINTLTASYGHGIAVSDMQLAAAVATIAGDGVYVQPTLVLDPNAKEKETDKSAVRVVSPQTSHKLRQMMRLVVTEGTGTHADVPGYRIAGKTGTAEKPGPHGYDHHKLISSFVGVFPAEAPDYLVLAVVDEPHGTKASYGFATGGWVAAPAVGKIVAAMGPLLGIPAKADDPAQDIATPLQKYVHDEKAEAQKQQDAAGETKLATY